MTQENTQWETQDTRTVQFKRPENPNQPIQPTAVYGDAVTNNNPAVVSPAVQPEQEKSDTDFLQETAKLGLLQQDSNIPTGYNVIPYADLPSKGIFYKTEEGQEEVLYVKRFSINDVSNLHLARVNNSWRIITQVINNTLHNFNAYNLTEGDVQYLMFWHRLNSYKKNKLVIDFHCTDSEHIAKVLTGKLTEDTLKQSHIVEDNAVQDIRYVDEVNIQRIIEEFHKNYGIYLYPNSMADIIELTELYEENAKLPDNEIMLLNYAKFINKGHVKDKMNNKNVGKSVQVRKAYLQSLSDEGIIDPDALLYIDEFAEAIQHGVSEKIKVKCKCCNAVQEKEFTVSVDMFFRPNN